jgi:chorismate-pyruvate lyase
VGLIWGIRHAQWQTLCEGTTSHKLYEREKGKFKQGENILLRELFKGTVALFAVEGAFA